MPSLVNSTPFIICPSDDLLERHHHIKHSSAELAIAYAKQNILVTDDNLQAIGSALWHALQIDDEFTAHQQQAGNHITPIQIESSHPAIQQLPWETLYHPEYGFLAKQKTYSLSRCIPNTHAYQHHPETGPLRILLFTAMTEDQSRLQVEKEQASVQEALLPWVMDGTVILEMPNDGRFSSFKTFVKDFAPHVLFISGHGEFKGNELTANEAEATFLFEAETGLGSQPINQTEIANALHGIPLECIVLSACQSGMGSSENLSAGLMTHLATQGIPHVIGMRESIFDIAGIQFARSFCDAIAQKERVDIALQTARDSISQPFKGYRKDNSDRQIEELSYGQWCLPALISHAPERPLINWNFTPQKLEINTPSQTLNSVTLAKQFIGRRLQLRELAIKLNTTGYQQLLIIGPGGQGKTALAGKLVQTLQDKAQIVIAWSARPENDWDDFLFEVTLLLNEENRDRYDRKCTQHKDELKRTHTLIDLLNQQLTQGLLIFFDNLESLQDPTTLALSQGHFSLWIDYLQATKPKNLNLILTSRWQLPNWPDTDTLSLANLSYNDYLQLARQTRLSKALINNRDRLRQLHHILHGNARALAFFISASQEMDTTEEQQFLHALETAKAEIQVDMALQAVIAHRSEAEISLLQRMTAYHTPVFKEGILRLAIDEQGDTLQHLKQLVNVSLVEKRVDYQLQAEEYQCAPLVTDWLKQQSTPAPSPEVLSCAADYQYYLLTYQRRTLTQAITCHQAFLRAERQQEAHRLVLDRIIGPLNRAGLYQRIIEEWLPGLCISDDKQIRGEALGQMGKQFLHIGDYETALKYLEQSLAIQQEIGDKSGEGTTLNNISQIYDARGDYETALKYLEQSLAIQQEIGDKSGEGTTLNNISQYLGTRRL